MRKQWLAAIVLLVAGAAAVRGARAATLNLDPSALVSLPGQTSGWGFTITSAPIDYDGSTITPWLLITGEEYELNNGDYPVGVFMPFITLPSNYMVIGPSTGNGEQNPWSQAFDNGLETGAGSYTINTFEPLGASDAGQIVLTYDEYSVSPNSPAFDPYTDTIATGLEVSAATSVLVGTPEPAPAAMLLVGCALLASVRAARLTIARRVGRLTIR